MEGLKRCEIWKGTGADKGRKAVAGSTGAAQGNTHSTENVVPLSAVPGGTRGGACPRPQAASLRVGRGSVQVRKACGRDGTPAETEVRALWECGWGSQGGARVLGLSALPCLTAQHGPCAWPWFSWPWWESGLARKVPTGVAWWAPLRPGHGGRVQGGPLLTGTQCWEGSEARKTHPTNGLTE